MQTQRTFLSTDKGALAAQPLPDFCVTVAPYISDEEAQTAI